MKANGAKVIAGGYNKAEIIVGNQSDLTNRVLITMYPSKAASGKAWAEAVRPWLERIEGKYATATVIGVEGVEQK